MAPLDRVRLALCLAEAVAGGAGPTALFPTALFPTALHPSAVHPSCSAAVSPPALIDIGGDLYERGAGPHRVECWFATLQPAAAVSSLATAAPLDGCTLSTVSVAPLGATAVCVRGPRTCATVAAAYRLLSAVLVEELLAAATPPPHRPPPPYR